MKQSTAGGQVRSNEEGTGVGWLLLSILILVLVFLPLFII
jgi:hypothetical protein